MMTDDKTQPDPNERREQPEPKQSGNGAQQRQAGKPDASLPVGRSSVSGRKPLFRS